MLAASTDSKAPVATRSTYAGLFLERLVQPQTIKRDLDAIDALLSSGCPASLRRRS